MRTITLSEAFSLAPPRRPAVMCIPGLGGSTEMMMTEWFNWLNLKRQPMIAYAMQTTGELGQNIHDGDEVYLAFPRIKDALCYKDGVRTAARGQEKVLPKGVQVCKIEGIPVEIPQECDVVLKCTIAGSYKYPFKKVRIFNCNLEEAMKE